MDVPLEFKMADNGKTPHLAIPYGANEEGLKGRFANISEVMIGQDFAAIDFYAAVTPGRPAVPQNLHVARLFMTHRQLMALAEQIQNTVTELQNLQKKLLEEKPTNGRKT